MHTNVAALRVFPHVQLMHIYYDIARFILKKSRQIVKLIKPINTFFVFNAYVSGVTVTFPASVLRNDVYKEALFLSRGSNNARYFQRYLLTPPITLNTSTLNKFS